MFILPLLLASAAAGNGPAPTKGYTPLANLVDRATVICIGHVDEVIEVDTDGAGWPSKSFESLRIGRIVIERVIKGPADMKVAYHELWTTWVCDSTRARVGERALFLLGTGKLPAAPPAVRDAVHSALGTDVVFRNVGAGDGIEPIRVLDGQEIVSCSGTPEALVIRGYADAPLADVVSYIETLVRFAPDAVHVHARAMPLDEDVNRDQWFDVRILSDGSCRLAVSPGRAEKVRLLQLNSSNWAALRSRLEYFVGREHRLAGATEELHWTPRRLSVRLPDGCLTYVEPTDNRSEWFASLDRTLLHDALWAWDAVFQELNCADCYDYTLADREMLRAR